jgi:hypothetical protein
VPFLFLDFVLLAVKSESDLCLKRTEFPLINYVNSEYIYIYIYIYIL